MLIITEGKCVYIIEFYTNDEPGDKSSKQKENNSLKLPEPLVSGKDLISLGYKPGPIFNTIIKRVLDSQIEGVLSLKEEAIEFVLKEFPQNKQNLK